MLKEKERRLQVVLDLEGKLREFRKSLGKPDIVDHDVHLSSTYIASLSTEVAQLESEYNAKIKEVESHIREVNELWDDLDCKAASSLELAVAAGIRSFVLADDNIAALKLMKQSVGDFFFFF